MLQHAYTSLGIVLARRNYSEADRIVVIFSKNFGKISLIAKGVRKPKSKKRGSIEIFNIVKFSASKTKSIDIMTESIQIESFIDIKKDLKKVAVAYYLMEVIGRITVENEAHDEIYELMVKYLNLLKSGDNLKDLRQNFIYEVLTNLGFWPRGKTITNPDRVIEDIVERKMNSARVGRRMLS
ncbi:DNA repair protein RecO [Candidatus Woesebacteria bacterium RIFCSPLOWO2_01_FULL_39_23]|uniref:DNA repair protein RecO n=1 Tax=Candidatus Woesebacteria bacterium RIFCSPHIGHO2_01_FULL_40_22 TaxID=1802499 RepID=A0A1F7YLQ3_9BACT|nr:MAG: DNA repair protein RecO [Candidatus Woesebacteria bacterium RBG_16_40_11]OGM27528.1 MAG: DNA repair protein RecO [Candidatus Woesebacteria bacterium RIFCSPHIGHO2_01_FULL_40_22]OGM36120.1 MAG: DNA repair protein RecO [Candidatus Woesebacteria bacterium RIFCSPHIGHO2_12_FULL_38_9]OGM62702.1 MAG: DNA repair protein RecO [Candidatus Woesebacteria bacterium RIFCSPLOWO2_01_FULL_39_23]